MKALSFVGVNLDTNKEHEILAEPLKGLVAEVLFKNGQKETFNNLTEVHWIYPSPLNEKRVAFESNIHGTGYTYDLSNIESCVIDTADLVAASI